MTTWERFKQFANAELKAAEAAIVRAGTDAASRIASDPATQHALDTAGQRLAAPTSRKLTPTVIAIGVGVLVFGAVLVWAVKRK